jgi:transcriptional regulator with XRE-family HTH domain
MPGLDKVKLGRVIAARRRDLGLTQSQLARMVGVEGGQAVSRWETGVTQPQDLPAVARALELSLTELMGEVDPHESRQQRGERKLAQLEEALDRLEALERRLGRLERRLAELVAQLLEREMAGPPARRRSAGSGKAARRSRG